MSIADPGKIMTDRILLSPPDTSDLDRAALLRAFDSGWIAPLGPELDGFELELGTYVGSQDCAGLSSGTAALQLGLQLVGVKPGDEVVVQSATFAASAFAVIHAGATPVFCDSAADTWCLDPVVLREYLAIRAGEDRLPAAVMPVDLYGFMPDYEKLVSVCDEFGVPIVEDSAEALGSRAAGGRSAGMFGRIGVFSFNGNKILTTSGGGAMVGEPELVEKARWLASQAREDQIWYEHNEIGFNFRMSNLLAALGRSQLAGLEDKVKRRTEVNAIYKEQLSGVTWAPAGTTERPNNWLSVGLLDNGIDPIELCRDMTGLGVEARPFWKPMHQQPVFSRSEMLGGEISDDLFARGICLPSGSAMTESQQDRVISVFKKLTD
jgi:dTDP-4-amino-4,6-dideoxygalactose transaminase